MTLYENLQKEITDVIFCYKTNPSWHRYEIPFSAFDYNNDTRILGCYKLRMEDYFRSQGIRVRIDTLYEARRFIVVEDVCMSENFIEFGIEIPYGERSKYFKAIHRISNIVGEDGDAVIAVDNNPYVLECIIAVRTTLDKVNEINQIISDARLKRDNTVSISSLYQDCKKRKLDIRSLPLFMNFEEFSFIISNMFWFNEEEDIRNSGYSFRLIKIKLM